MPGHTPAPKRAGRHAAATRRERALTEAKSRANRVRLLIVVLLLAVIALVGGSLAQTIAGREAVAAGAVASSTTTSPTTSSPTTSDPASTGPSPATLGSTSDLNSGENGYGDPDAGTDASADTGTAPSTSAGTPVVVTTGDGRVSALEIPGQDTGHSGRPVTFTIEAEGGLGIDLAEFAASVRQTLSDSRGWETADDLEFVAVSPEQARQGAPVEVRITLASPTLTDKLCAPLKTGGEVSCNHNSRAVINAKRWMLGVAHYDDLDLYRTYVINHEVGHGLWHPHEECLTPGKPAPIMLQQTLGLDGCLAWPYPTRP